MKNTNHFRSILTLLWLLVSAYIWQPSVSLAQEQLSAKVVDQAIRRTVDFLKQAQLRGGGWDEFQAYDMGVSSIVTLALLNAGQDPKSPDMIKALNYITSKRLTQTYTISLQTMAMCAADPNLYAAQIESNARWLIENQCSDGGWTYQAKNSSRADPSNSQFALLALHDAQRVGVAIPKEILKKSFDAARNYWNRLQNDDGSFCYDSNMAASGSMTCAGISSLIIVGSQADQLGASATDEIACCGGSDENRRRIEKALEWMGRNFDVRRNPGSSSFYYYYMYGLERAGRLSGRRFFLGQGGVRDWYREGCRALLQQQTPSGAFAGAQLGNVYSESALALLFLAKGKRQVLVNWLEYGNSTDWNTHPQSVQHLISHTEMVWKRDLTWQSVKVKQAKMEDFAEAPVLFISGPNPPNFTREEKLLLKRFVEQQQGFIFAEACQGNGCQGAAFEEYFKKLVVELFEQPLEKLSPDHPIWSAEAKVDPKDLPEGAWLYGVQSCCRLAVVYSPYSLSCRWELNLPYGNRPEYSPKVLSDLETATKLGINVLSYATGRELKEKLDNVSILDEVVQKTYTDRGLFILPILQHNAGADDAPRSTKTLIEWLNQENPFQMSSEKRMIPISDDSLMPYSVVYMHGRGKLDLTEPQREALRIHFENGGTLIADAICADEQFVDSFRTQMQEVLGQPMQVLDPATHPLFTSAFSGFDIKQLSVVDPTEGSKASLAESIQRRPTLIEAGTYDGRICVLFSPLDISCALESKHSLQCRGYTREDAARLGINLVLFALQQGPK